MTIQDPAAGTPAALFARLGRLLTGRRSRCADESGASSGPPALVVTPTHPSSARVAEHHAEIERIAMAANADASQCAAVFAQLQSGSPSKLLDLRAVEDVTADLFTRLARSWQAPRGTVCRLAIVLGYECWVALHQVIPRRLWGLTDRGVNVATFYEQQLDSVEIWFAGGPIVHDELGAVVAWLRDQSPASRTLPVVLDTTAMLVRGFAARDEVPELLIELAAIARTLGGTLGAIEAAKYAEAALGWIGDTPCRARCHALRALASARLRVGEVGAGVTLLEAAITTAAVIGDRSEEAGAQAEIGLYVLQTGHPQRAEARFRSALAVLPTDDAQRATLHRYLARALYEQGQRDDDAEQHATAALSLRWDPRGQLAGEDRALLVRIRARRRAPSAAARRGEPAHSHLPRPQGTR